MTAICLFKLKGPCLQTADQLLLLHQDLDHKDLIIKTHILLDKLTLSFLAMLFGRQLSLTHICKEINEALELMESLDELPTRGHSLGLLEQIAPMLFVKPL